MHPMELLGDTGHVESRFCPFRAGFSVGARQVHGLRQTYHRLRKSFWTHLMVLLDTSLKWQLVPFQLEIELVLTQDRCTLCAERTICSEIILDAPDETPR